MGLYDEMFFGNYLSSSLPTCYFHCDLDFGISVFKNENIKFFPNFNVS
jgi:hypothetical protein